MKEQKSTKGRKPVDDPKVSLRVYINQSYITKLGGYLDTQLAVMDFIAKKAKKIK